MSSLIDIQHIHKTSCRDLWCYAYQSHIWEEYRSLAWRSG